MLELRVLHFEDLSVGMSETFTKTVASSDVVGFAEVTGDRNPIHLSQHFAAKTPFGTTQTRVGSSRGRSVELVDEGNVPSSMTGVESTTRTAPQSSWSVQISSWLPDRKPMRSGLGFCWPGRSRPRLRRTERRSGFRGDSARDFPNQIRLFLHRF